MKEKRENLDIVFNNFKFKKFNVTYVEFNELSADTKYKYI